MILHSPRISGQETRKHFFIVEKPGFDVALISGTEEDIPGNVNTDGIEWKIVICTLDANRQETRLNTCNVIKYGYLSALYE